MRRTRSRYDKTERSGPPEVPYTILMYELTVEAYALDGLGLMSAINVFHSRARRAGDDLKRRGGIEPAHLDELVAGAAAGLILTAATAWHEEHRDEADALAAEILGKVRRRLLT
jgi:hypothetical protein